MAVTLTDAELALALRLITAADETLDAGIAPVVTRHRETGKALVERYAPDAPTNVQNEAVIRIAGYLYDKPPEQPSAGILLRSGAQALLSPWVMRGVGDSGTTATTPTPGSGVSEARVNELIAAALANLPPSSDPYVLPEADADTLGGVRAITDDLIDADTSTSVFAWAISHVKRLINAIVPAWARMTNPPVSPAEVARIPDPAIPAPSQATRGHALAQAADGETYVFRQGGEANDGTARQLATAAAEAANEAKSTADAAETTAATATTAAASASQQARDVQHLAEDNHEHIEALEGGGLLTTGYGAWALWTENEWHAGFQLATGLDNTFRAADFGPGSNIYSGVATNRRIAMSVPAGVDPARIRARLTLNGVESFKPGNGEEWLAFTPADANTRRDYYYLAVASSGNHAVTTFAANDRVDLQIRPVVPVMNGDRFAPRSVVAAVQDVIVGDVVDHSWEDVETDGSEGGLTSANQSWNLAKAKAATYSAPSVNGVENESQIVRVPASVDPRHYRLVIVGVGTEQLNHFSRLGADDDWQYYEQGVGLPDPATVTLQVDDRVLGHTTFDGVLGPKAKASLGDLGGSGGVSVSQEVNDSAVVLAATYTDIDEIAVTVATGQKVMLLAHCAIGTTHNTVTRYAASFRIVRGDTVVRAEDFDILDVSSSSELRTLNSTIVAVDASPGTGSVTYKFQAQRGNQVGSGDVNTYNNTLTALVI